MKLMLRVFEKAETVIAWMGKMEAQHEPYMAFIKQEMGQTKSAIDSVEAEIHQDECTKAVRNLQDSLRRFTCTPWFKRTWIRQEVFAAKSIWIYFEDFKMQFDFQNKKFWQWLRCDPASLLDGPRAPKKPQQHRHPRPPRPELAPQFLIMASHFRHHGTDNKDYTPPQVKISHGLHWLRTLQEGTGFQVTDPRDRVYALLGIIASPSTRFWVAPAKHGTVMTNGTTPKDFPVDYERSISMVYQDVVKYLINVERNLDSLCTFQDRRRHNSDVPSWALDWRDDSARTFIESSQDLAELEQVLGQPPLQDLNEFSVLHVSGFQASKIFSLQRGQS